MGNCCGKQDHSAEHVPPDENSGLLRKGEGQGKNKARDEQKAGYQSAPKEEPQTPPEEADEQDAARAEEMAPLEEATAAAVAAAVPQGQAQGVDAGKPADMTRQETEEKEEAEDEDEVAIWPPGDHYKELQFDLKVDLPFIQEKYAKTFKPLLPRQFEAVAEPSAEQQHSITVLQFNILADLLSGAYAKGIDPKSFLGVPKECLDWKYRGVRVMEEALRHDTDVICMEECDRPDFVRQYLQNAGYEVFYQPKIDAPTRKVAKKLAAEQGVDVKELNIHDDGLVIAFKKSVFTLCAEEQRFDDNNTESNVVGLGVPVRHNESGREFLFFSTHLKSTKSEEGEQRRVKQVSELFPKAGDNPEGRAVILCCDMNANPVVNKNGYGPDAYNLATSQDDGGCGFMSAYTCGKSGNEPEFTTYKKRKGLEDQHTIDYIFLKGGREGPLQVTELLSIPENNVPFDAEESFLPAWNYPSDHFALGARIAF